MDFLLDPNIAYLILARGVLLAMLSLASPGTGYLKLEHLLHRTGGVCDLQSLVQLVGIAASGSQHCSFCICHPETRARALPCVVDPPADCRVGLHVPAHGRSGIVNPFVAILASGLVAGFCGSRSANR